MAIVIDRARGAVVATDAQKNAHNTTYQKGNDHASTPSPTWLKNADLLGPDTLETHIGFAYEAGVDNTLNLWVPHLSFVFLTSTPATVRH